MKTITKTKNEKDAVKILYNRYIKNDPKRHAALEKERVNAQVARTIYELRKDAGLSQGELAELVETTQSVISRLEDADYDGHSLSMLQRIAKALSCRLNVTFKKDDPKVTTLRYAFGELIKKLRLEGGWSIDQFVKKAGIDKEEALSIERDLSYKPSPLTLYKIAEFYKIPQQKIAVLAGAIKPNQNNIVEYASRFAAQSESFSRLEPDEKLILDEFVKFLREEISPSE
ncbi:helix-turn-helix domain-containing protein [Desulfobacterium sp. N47]|uniref:helix-turn-helix domain-containing protein n=1 Tax=Desulfobacterium sp. N47 TaxID=3115210 RepID=UPI003CA39494